MYDTGYDSLPSTSGTPYNVTSGDYGLTSSSSSDTSNSNLNRVQFEDDLHKAIKNNDIDEVKHLINEGEDVNKRNSDGSSALHLAIENDCIEIVDFLLNCSTIEIDKFDKRKNTPLHIAFKNYRFACAKKLLQHNADVSVQDLAGNTVLHFAIENNRVEYVRILLEKNDERKFKAKNIEIAFEIGIDEEHKAAALLLKKYEKNPVRWQSIYDTIVHLGFLKNKSNRDDCIDGRNDSNSQTPKRLRTDNGWKGPQKAGNLRTSLHGVFFQVKLLMIFLKTSLEKGYEFYMGSEFLAAGDLDDIVIRYSSIVNQWTLRFLQAKHRIDPDKNKITLSELTKISGGDFDIIKYFRSFCKIIEEPLFAGNKDLSHIKDCTIITNTDFDFRPREVRSNKDGSDHKADVKENANRKKWQNFFLTTNLSNTDEFLYITDGAKVNVIDPEYYDEVKEIIKSTLETRRGKKFTEEDVDTKIIRFLEKLVFITNYPNENDLDVLITDKLGEKFEMFNATFLFDSFLREIVDYLKIYDDGTARFYDHVEGEKFYVDLKGRIYTLMLTGLSLALIKKIESSVFRFEIDLKCKFVKNIHEFLHQRETNNILLLNTACCQLSTTKIRQILQTKEFINNFEYLKFSIGAYIFIDTAELLRTKEMFDLSLKSNKRPSLLVIQCPFVSSQHFDQISTICTSFAKTTKVILIFSSEYESRIEFITDEKITYSNLTLDSQIELLKKEVSLQGNRIQLNQLIDINSAKQVIDSPNCLAQLFPDKSITLGNLLAHDPFSFDGYVEKYYIDRNLREQWIKSDILAENIKSALFFISCEPVTLNVSSQLKEIEPNYIHDWNENGNYRNGIVLLPKNQENAKHIFTKLCEKHRTIYWLEFRLIKSKESINPTPSNTRRNLKQFRLYWKGFKGPNASLVHNHIEKEIDRSDVHFDESQLIGTEQKVVIIADYPGFGKSTFLTKLAKKLRDKSANNNPSPWIVRIDLKEYTRPQNVNNLKNELFESETSRKCIEAAEIFVTNIAVPHENYGFEKNLFAIGIHKSKLTHQLRIRPKIIVLIDGFDEISPDYKTNTTNLIKAIEKTDVAQLWVTTRKNEKDHLEDELKSSAFTLDPFNKKQQNMFLSRFWRLLDKTPNKAKAIGHKDTRARPEDSPQPSKRRKLKQPETLNSSQSESSIRYSKKARELIKKANQSKDPTKTYSLTEVPFNLKVLAEVVLERKFNLDKINELVDVDIYKEIIDAVFHKYKNEKCGTSNENISASNVTKSMFKNYRYYHELYALKHIFPEHELPQLNSLKKIDKEIKDNLLKMQFLKSQNENAFSFEHQIFAECFVGKHLANDLQDENIRNLVIKHVFRKRNYANICNFFKYYILQDGKAQNLREFFEESIEMMCKNDDLKQQAKAIAEKLYDFFWEYPKNFQLYIDESSVRCAVAIIPNDSPIILSYDLLENRPVYEYEIRRICYKGTSFHESTSKPEE